MRRMCKETRSERGVLTTRRDTPPPPPMVLFEHLSRYFGHFGRADIGLKLTRSAVSGHTCRELDQVGERSPPKWPTSIHAYTNGVRRSTVGVSSERLAVLQLSVLADIGVWVLFFGHVNSGAARAPFECRPSAAREILVWYDCRSGAARALRRTPAGTSWAPTIMNAKRFEAHA